MSMLKKFWKDEAGLESLEYGIIAAVILVALIVAYNALVGSVDTKLDDLASDVEAAGTVPTP